MDTYYWSPSEIGSKEIASYESSHIHFRSWRMPPGRSGRWLQVDAESSTNLPSPLFMAWTRVLTSWHHWKLTQAAMRTHSKLYQPSAAASGILLLRLATGRLRSWQRWLDVVKQNWATSMLPVKVWDVWMTGRTRWQLDSMESVTTLLWRNSAASSKNSWRRSRKQSESRKVTSDLQRRNHEILISDLRCPQNLRGCRRNSRAWRQETTKLKIDGGGGEIESLWSWIENLISQNLQL